MYYKLLETAFKIQIRILIYEPCVSPVVQVSNLKKHETQRILKETVHTVPDEEVTSELVRPEIVCRPCLSPP